MTMTIPWLGPWVGSRSGPAERKPRTAQPRNAETRLAADPALKLLLERRDDRLLRDAGLTRAGVLGEAEVFWSERARRRDLWWP